MKTKLVSKILNLTWSLLLLGVWNSAAWAAGDLRPFFAADAAGDTVGEAVTSSVAKLENAGFEVVGQYEPYDNGAAIVIGATNAELRRAAAGHEFGGFGGVLRVSVTDNAGEIEVGYVNPEYIGYAYHLGDLSAVTGKLAAALGKGEAYGSEGLSADQLEEYHYMMFMPYFTDKRVIGRFSDHQQAVQKVAAALTAPDSDMLAVWQVKISDTQTLFGVKLHGGEWKGQIKEIMGKIDIGTPKSTAALPWELLVTGNRLVYLPGKFRIAVMFPDLPMGTFMKISNVPDDMDASVAALAKRAK